MSTCRIVAVGRSSGRSVPGRWGSHPGDHQRGPIGAGDAVAEAALTGPGIGQPLAHRLGDPSATRPRRWTAQSPAATHRACVDDAVGVGRPRSRPPRTRPARPRPGGSSPCPGRGPRSRTAGRPSSSRPGRSPRGPPGPGPRPPTRRDRSPRPAGVQSTEPSRRRFRTSSSPSGPSISAPPTVHSCTPTVCPTDAARAPSGRPRAVRSSACRSLRSDLLHRADGAVVVALLVGRRDDLGRRDLGGAHPGRGSGSSGRRCAAPAPCRGRWRPPRHRRSAAGACCGTPW